MLLEPPDAFLILVTSKKADPVMDEPSAGNKVTYRQTVARRRDGSLDGRVLLPAIPPCSCFFLVFNRSGARKFRVSAVPAARDRELCGAAQPTIPRISRQPPSQPHNPLAMVRPTAKRARQALEGRRSHAR
jgi:hypothetical protein